MADQVSECVAALTPMLEGYDFQPVLLSCLQAARSVSDQASECVAALEAMMEEKQALQSLVSLSLLHLILPGAIMCKQIG